MRPNRTRGFTLVELMITVVIVAILATIAYPIYITQVRQARRADAKSLILRAANRQQQYYASQHQYTSDLSALGLAASNTSVKTENGAYKISAATSDSNQKFTITAAAIGDQQKDRCTQYQIKQNGQRTPNTGNCW